MSSLGIGRSDVGRGVGSGKEMRLLIYLKMVWPK